MTIAYLVRVAIRVVVDDEAALAFAVPLSVASFVGDSELVKIAGCVRGIMSRNGLSTMRHGFMYF